MNDEFEGEHVQLVVLLLPQFCSLFYVRNMEAKEWLK